MFQKINYLSLVLLIAILAFMLYKDGWTEWKKAPRRNFSMMAAQAGISDKEKLETIKKRYGEIEKLIEQNQLEKALLLLKQMEPDYSTDAHLYLLEGKIYAKMKLYKEAAVNFLKMVKLDAAYIGTQREVRIGENKEGEGNCTDETVISSIERSTSPFNESYFLKQEFMPQALSYYKGKDDPTSKEALKVVYALQRRLAGGCE